MMMRYLFAILLTCIATHCWADEARLEHLVLAEAPIDRTDLASIKRGAKFFAANCITCHTAVYLRYNKIAIDAGITIDKMPINVKIWPNGVKPPDLSLEASVRGVDWIYTYLHSFYRDTSRPTGFNNLVFPDTGMIDIVAPYQGEQALVQNPMSDLLGHYQWYDLVNPTKQGSMTPEEFDANIADLVNFLAYAAEPYYIEQHRLGIWVLLFIAVLFVLMYKLKREYWKDVKKHRQ